MDQILLLAFSSALTAFVYCLYRRSASIASSLIEAEKVTLHHDLQRILIDTPGQCVPYAAIKGVVRSVNKTLKSEFVFRGHSHDIIRWTPKNKKMERNQAPGFWDHYECIIYQHNKIVPFVTIATSIPVNHPLEAERGLEKIFKCFDFLRSRAPEGVTEIEDLVRLGARITGVGELVLDGGIFRLQPPKQGLPYILTSLHYNTLLEYHKSRASFYGGLLALMCLTACVTLVFILY